jgi:hypothetical protein
MPSGRIFGTVFQGNFRRRDTSIDDSPAAGTNRAPQVDPDPDSIGLIPLQHGRQRRAINTLPHTKTSQRYACGHSDPNGRCPLSVAARPPLLITMPFQCQWSPRALVSRHPSTARLTSIRQSRTRAQNTAPLSRSLLFSTRSDPATACAHNTVHHHRFTDSTTRRTRGTRLHATNNRDLLMMLPAHDQADGSTQPYAHRADGHPARTTAHGVQQTKRERNTMHPPA